MFHQLPFTDYHWPTTVHRLLLLTTWADYSCFAPWNFQCLKVVFSYCKKDSQTTTAVCSHSNDNQLFYTIHIHVWSESQKSSTWLVSDEEQRDNWQGLPSCSKLSQWNCEIASIFCQPFHWSLAIFLLTMLFLEWVQVFFVSLSIEAYLSTNGLCCL